MTASVELAELIQSHHEEIMARWERAARERLSLKDEVSPQLRDHFPTFLEDLVRCLRIGPEAWGDVHESARTHGRQRLALGVDIGALAIEFNLVGETILLLAAEHGRTLATSDVVSLLRLVARGTAHSVTEYAELRDRQLERESSRHFSFVAHEIRTPLNTARLAASLLGSHPEDSKRYVERIHGALEQLGRIVDDALVEARLRDEPLVRYESQRASALVASAIDNVKLVAERANIELVDQSTELELSVDPKLVVSALTNLLHNAIKFSPEGSMVTVTASAADRRARFEVSDACGGLAPGVAAQLFRPYVQHEKDRSGFGLGLMIVKQAFEVHGGSIRVEDRAPHGCCFIGELPLRKPDARGH